MNKKLTTMLCLLALASGIQADGIRCKTDPSTGSIREISIDKDKYQMNWILSPDGKQYPWVTDKYGWGLGFLTINGQPMEWKTPVSLDDNGMKVTYQAGPVSISVKRNITNGELTEEYTFKNTSKTAASLTDWGIYTPWNDNYTTAATCMTNRCDANIWAGDQAAYVCALRMGDNGKNEAKGTGNVGLMLTRGSLPDYEEWERKKENANSNFRGVIAMDLPDMTLPGGKSYTVSWKVFEHGGKNDFYKKLLDKGGAVVKSGKYVYEQGETAKVYLEKNKLKQLSATVNGQPVKTAKDSQGYFAYFQTNQAGEQRVDLTYDKTGHTHANLLVVSGYEKLMGKRVQFILDYQQMNDTADQRYGAYMVYDNEKHAIYKNDDQRKSSDCDEGRERVGMGVLLAQWYMKHPDEQLKQSLIRYATFLRTKLQTDDYTTYSKVTKQGKNRGYNYAWVSDFYFRMYEVTHDRQYAIDGYQTMQALYRHNGYKFYCIGYPVTISLKVLREAGLQTEYNDLLVDYSRTADIFMKNGLNFPKSEVNFEQSIIAPAAQFLLEFYLQTQDKRYLDAAEKMMPVVENFCGRQPDYRLNEISIRHWDCYWFGKRQVFGDTFPHYWSCVNAAVYYYYALATGKAEYKDRAKEVVRNNLCNVFEDGTASCAFVYPKRINGEKAHFADAFANDQDWALSYYLTFNE